MKISLEIVASHIDCREINSNDDDAECSLEQLHFGAKEQKPSFGELIAYEHDGDVVLKSSTGTLKVPNANLHTVFNQVIDVFSLYNHWEKEMMRLLYGQIDWQQIARHLYLVLQNPLFIANRKGEVLAFLEEFKTVPIGRNWLAVAREGALDDSSLRTISDNPLTPYPSIASTPDSDNVYYYQCPLIPDDPYALIVYAVDYLSPLKKSGLQILRAFQEMTTQALSLTSHSFPTIHSLFSSLLNGEVVRPETISWLLIQLKWERESQFRLLLFMCPDTSKDNTLVLGKLLRVLPKCGYALCEGGFIIVAKEGDIDSILVLLKASHLRDFYRCGVSLPFDSLSEIKGPFIQAEGALAYFPEDQIVECDKHVIEITELLILQHFNSLAIVHEAVLKLRRHDERKHSDLLQTLCVYIECERDIKRTSKKMQIHRNTLMYRLNCISQIIDLGLLDSPAERLIICLSNKAISTTNHR